MQEREDSNTSGALDVASIVRQALHDFVRMEHTKAEPAYKVELQEERRRREQLEKRLNELVEENKKSRHIAEEAERSSAIRAELQRLGVAKVDLAFKAVQDSDCPNGGRALTGEERAGRKRR